MNSNTAHLTAFPFPNQEPVIFSLSQRDIGNLFFNINSQTGQITLKVSVLRASEVVFRVSVFIVLAFESKF